jgi:hypothetical protein
MWSPYGAFLLRCYSGRCLWWSFGIRYQQNGRCWWSQVVVMDLHPRGYPHPCCCLCRILGHQRLSSHVRITEPEDQSDLCRGPSLHIYYSAKFLSEEERVEVERRLKADRSSLADEFDIKYAFDALKDWKIYVHMLITIGIYTPLYSISLFLPTIVKNMGYTNEKSQLMTVPVYVVACVFTISAGFLADRMRQRGIFMLFFEVVAIIGFAMLASSGKPSVQYLGTFFAASGIYPLVPMGVAWNGNNIGGSLKRGVGIAMHVGFGNLGGAISAFCFLPQYSPRFVLLLT